MIQLKWIYISILIATFLVALAAGVIIRQYQQERVEKAATKKIVETEETVKVSILVKEQWANLDSPKPTLKPKIQAWRGHGPSVQLKLSRGGTLKEVYKDWTVEDGPKREDITARVRQVEPGMVRVIAGAYIYLDDQLIYQPLSPFTHRTQLKEIRDPVWKPEKIEKSFASLAELRKHVETTREWVAMMSPAGEDLLGWWYGKDRPVYRVNHEGRTFYALGFSFIGKEKWTIGKFAPVHIKYRYLGIYAGGHDILYGPGCISLFAFPEESDTNDISAAKMLEVNQDGSLTYFRNPIPRFAWETIR